MISYPAALSFLDSADRGLFMGMFLTYFDESGKKGDHKQVTIALVGLMQPRLKAFDEAWEGLLRYNGVASLHMAKASRLKERYGARMPRGQTEDERTDALIPFAECINDHMEIGIIQAWDVKGFHSLSPKALRGLGSPDDPYYLAFSRALMELADYVTTNDRISLICDHDEATGLKCYQHYCGVRRVRREVRDKTVALSFANDDYFPALQAADMVAFLSRQYARFRMRGDYFCFKRLFRELVKPRGPNHTVWSEYIATEAACKELNEGLEHPYRTVRLAKQQGKS